MKNRDIVIGLVVILLIAGVIFFIRRPEEEVEDQTPTIEEVEEELEESFKFEIPEDVLKVKLLDVVKEGLTGLATKDEQEGMTSYTVLVDLPDPEEGTFYEAWLVKKNEEGEDTYVSIGKLRVAKGGYLLEHDAYEEELKDYNMVIITREKVADSTPEEIILEGSF